MSRHADGRGLARVAWLLAIPLVVAPAGTARAQAPGGLVLVGVPELHENLRVSVGYLRRPVALEPGGQPVDAGSIHLQVEVEAATGNGYGFDADDSVPYLRIPFVVIHEPSGRRVEGRLEPMVSRDGFHYGANVLMAGAGEYTLTVELSPPDGLARHTDPRSGVAAWWKPFKVTRRFTYSSD